MGNQAERFSWWKIPSGFYRRHDVQAIGTAPLGRRICDCYGRMLQGRTWEEMPG
jgi:hypothetical protein